MKYKNKYGDKVEIRGTAMQIDYLVMIDNHLMLLIDPFLRYTDKSYINKIVEDLVRHACETRLDIEKYLDSYTEQQKMNWKNSKKIVVYENKTQLYRFIEIDEDFLRIPEIINEPELIESAGMYNKNPVVHFKKNGITIVGIIADGALDLYTQTMYISKKIEALQQR